MRKVNEDAFWKEQLEATDSDTLHKSVLDSRLDDFLIMEQQHAESLKEYADKRVLDAGCGYGRMSKYFTNYVGVDISHSLIERAKEMFPDKTFIVGDLQSLPFKDNEFDVAFCSIVKNMIVEDLGVEYWNKIETELNRVAKKLIILETL